MRYDLRTPLMMAAALAVLAVALPARAEDSAPAPTAGQTLPFINEGANRPVLQAISPDGVALAPAMEAAAQDHAEHAEGHKKGLPQFDPSTYPKQLFWLALVFGSLYLVFSKLTLPAIGGMIERRAGKIADDLAEAEAMKNQVESIRAEYETAIAQAQQEAHKLVADVQHDIKRLAETQDEAFKANAENEINALESRIKIARTRIEGELSNAAADLAVDIAGRLAGVRADTAAARGLIDDLSGRSKAA